ncbi:MAG: hypothetical protein GXP54_13910 [Deltaproteobacteria bacterium]|nr:hypothetical protein [Deltaproteobacteria bacterium]
MSRAPARLWMLVLCAMMSWGAVAFADEPLSPGRLDPFWKGLDFGITRDNVVQFLKNRIASRYQTRIQDTMDVRERDSLTREMNARLAKVSANMVTFNGNQSGWGVSVIGKEFASDNGEQLLDILHNKEHVYLFFTKGVYYKMIRSGLNRPMSEWVTELQQEYGKPDRLEYQDPQTRSGIRLAQWKQGLLTVTLEDKTRLFQCVTIRWALAAADKAVKESWRKSARTVPGLNPLVKEATSPVDRESVNPVDAILGRVPAVKSPRPKKNPRKHR